MYKISIKKVEVIEIEVTVGLPNLYLPLSKEEVNAFAHICLSLSVCEQDYLKRRAWIWMKCCVSTDVGDMDELINF